ncbi:hypothetical protein BRC82_00215 [Halobacteriales archaeon QS_1_67_19]|nr:MAG: hypothetical protein BRC82_00215 [Halobacteriales archaeon QS_1_67_19]
MASLIQNVVDLIGYFTEVALSNPLSALLLLCGFVLVAFSSAVFGVLTAGAVVDFILPDSLGRRPPQQG